MAIKRSASWNKPFLHLLLRLLGLAGGAVAIIGCFIWQVLHNDHLGKIVLIAGAIPVLLALFFEIKSLMQGMSSRRGAVGINVILQISLALAAVVIFNVLSFSHYRRFDWTREHLFTLPEQVRTQLAKLRGETDIIILQQYVSFGQGGDNKQDKYDLAAQRKIVEKVKDLAEQFQDLGPRFRVQVLDIQDDDYLDKLRTIRAESKELADAIENAPENSIFFHARDRKQIQRLSFSDIYQLDKVASMKAGDSKVLLLAGTSTAGLLASPLGDGPLLAALALYPGRADGRGNLILKYQGVEGLARKILNIEEKKPRIATAIVHPVLGLQNRELDFFTMSGAKKILDDYGFDCTDIVLRKLDPDGDLTTEPTALSYEESRFEQIEDELADIDESLRVMTSKQREVEDAYREWSSSSLAQLNKKYGYFFLEDGRQGVMPRKFEANLKKARVDYKLIDVDNEDITNKISLHKRELQAIEELLRSGREEREKLRAEKGLLHVDRLAEKRRLTDVAAKMTDMLANVDLLIVPRITLMNAPQRKVISNRAHRLDPAQLKAIKNYMRQGKPVLFLLGPPIEPTTAPNRDFEGADQLETALTELGFRLPKQAILYDLEVKEFNERKVGVMSSKNRDIEVPGLAFDAMTKLATLGKYKNPFNIIVRKRIAPADTGTLVGSLALPGLEGSLLASAVWLHLISGADQEVPAVNPIRTSLKVTSQTAGHKKSFDVPVRHPRPVYYLRTKVEPESAVSLLAGLGMAGLSDRLQACATFLNFAVQVPDENAVFLLTREECWNEDYPFIKENRIPRYLPPKEDDPKRGSIEEVRRGPFPIGVAAEMLVPASWYDKEDAKQKKVRVAVIGSGNIFTGSTLSPLKGKIVLDTVNWLLSRDDLLSHDEHTWQYPRIEMSAEQKDLWEWGARAGLPLLFVFLGTVVWLVRNMR